MTTPAEVQRIAALQNPVLRNLEIEFARFLAGVIPDGDR